jgi:hypothetical protein
LQWKDGLLTEEELGLTKTVDRTKTDVAFFFALVVLSVVAYVGRKRFTMAKLIFPDHARDDKSKPLRPFFHFVSKLATLHSPKIMLISCFAATQVQVQGNRALGGMYAWYLLPTTVLLLFGSAHKYIWLPIYVYSASAWLTTYCWQFKVTGFTPRSWFVEAWGIQRFVIGDLWLNEELSAEHNIFGNVINEEDMACHLFKATQNISDTLANFKSEQYDCFNYAKSVPYDLWDSRLLAHVFVIASVTFYRITCDSISYRKMKSEPLFEGAWPHCPGLSGRLSALSVSHSKSVLCGTFVWARSVLNSPKRRFPARAVTPSEMERGGKRSLRMRFTASNLLLAFGQIAFFGTCLVVAAVSRNNLSVIYVLIMGVYFLRSSRKTRVGMYICFFLLVVVQVLVFGAAFFQNLSDTKWGKEWMATSSWGEDFMAVVGTILYFNRKECTSDDSGTTCTVSTSTFFMLFVMSTIIHNERHCRDMVRQKDIKEAAIDEEFISKSSRGVEVARLQEAIVRHIFMHDLNLHAIFEKVDSADDDGLLGVTDSALFVSTLQLAFKNSTFKNRLQDSLLIDLARSWEFEAFKAFTRTSFRMKGLEHGKFHVNWQNFCDEVGTDIQSRLTKLPSTAGFIMNLQPGTKTSIWDVLWSTFLTLCVDTMAIIIALVAVGVTKKSLITLGYLLFAIMFLHNQRSEKDGHMLRSLHTYTYLHLVVQAVYIFVDPACMSNEEFSKYTYIEYPVSDDDGSSGVMDLLCISGSPIGIILRRLVGVEDITADYIDFQMACLLFAWMIIVTELQKSRVYSRLRLHAGRDRKLARARMWVMFKQRLMERARAVVHIQHSLERLNNTAKKIGERRGTISHWHSLSVYTAANFKLGADQRRYTQLKVTVVEAQDLHERTGDNLVRLSLRNKNDTPRTIRAVQETAKAGPSEQAGVTGRDFKSQSFTFVMGTDRSDSCPDILVVELLEAEGDDALDPDVGAATNASRVVGNLCCEASLSRLESLVTIDEWYDLHGITGSFSGVHGRIRIQLTLIELKSNPSTSSMKLSGSTARMQDSNKPGGPKPKASMQSAALHYKNMKDMVSKLATNHRLQPGKWAMDILMTKHGHLNLSPEEAEKLALESSKTDRMVLIGQHMIVHTQRICVFLIVLNQAINHNIFSFFLTIITFGMMLCEHPNISSGFWSVLTHFLQIEIVFRYFLALDYWELATKCETDVDPDTFICNTLDPNDSLVILILLLACIYLHRYRMKRMGVWKYWTPFYEIAQKAHYARVQASALKSESLRKVLEARADAALLGNRGGKRSCFGRSPKGPPAQAQVQRGRTESGGEISILVDSASSLEDPKPHYTLFEKVEIALFAIQLRIVRFFKSFVNNVVFQNDPLPEAVRRRILERAEKQPGLGKLSLDGIEKLLADEGRLHENHRFFVGHRKKPSHGETMAKLLRKSLYKTSVDMYGESLILELMSLFTVIFVHAEAEGQDISAVTSNISTVGLSSGVLFLTLLQFSFIIIDRAAHLGESIQLKFFELWLSIVVYMTIMFSYTEFGTALHIFFFLKVGYWYCSCLQIRYGYAHEITQKKKRKFHTGIFREFGKLRHYGFKFVYSIPFGLDIRTALGWIFKKTTLRYEDARKVRKISSWPRSWGQLQPFIAVFPQECMGQLACFGPT